MAYRRVKTLIWTDIWFSGLSPDEKYLCLYLLTSKHTNINGCYFSPINTISAETGCTEFLVKATLARFMADMKISYEDEKLVVSPSLMRFVWWPHGPKGAQSGHWKGGITPKNQKIRASKEYKEWVREVFERDNYICRICGKSKCKLNAHHIKRFSEHPELRLNVNNGITLCEKCHRKEHSRHREGE